MNLLAMVPIPAIVKASLGATEAQSRHVATAAMKACATPAEQVELVVAARRFLHDLEAAW